MDLFPTLNMYSRSQRISYFNDLLTGFSADASEHAREAAWHDLARVLAPYFEERLSNPVIEVDHERLTEWARLNRPLCPILPFADSLIFDVHWHPAVTAAKIVRPSWDPSEWGLADVAEIESCTKDYAESVGVSLGEAVEDLCERNGRAVDSLYVCFAGFEGSNPDDGL